MPDIHLRLHRDMLVLSGSLDSALLARGYDADYPRELLAVNEPDSIVEPMRLEQAAGASCMVLPTRNITRAHLAHMRAEDKAAEVAQAALGIARTVPFMHVLAEIGPTGLPLDTSSKTSLVANRDQYADAARLFAPGAVDALFLNGMDTIDDLRCALMGLRKASDVIVFASVDANEQGCLAGSGEPIEEAVALMEEYGASVCGVQTRAPAAAAAEIARRMAQSTELPLLAQLLVEQAEDSAAQAPYRTPEHMLEAADALRGAGVQFLRACGSATAAYTAVLAATCYGKDAVR